MAKELAHHGYRISPGSLYPTLHKMEAEGLLRSTKKVAKGRRTLESTKGQLRELANEVLGDEAP